MWLRYVDNSTRHGTDHDNATRSLALDKVAGNASGEEVASVNIDGPALLHTLVRVIDGIEVLCETGRRDEVVDVAVLSKDFLNGLVDRVGAADVGVVSCNLGRTVDSSSQHAFILDWGEKKRQSKRGHTLPMWGSPARTAWPGWRPGIRPRPLRSVSVPSLLP